MSREKNESVLIVRVPKRLKDELIGAAEERTRQTGVKVTLSQVTRERLER